MHVWIMYQNGNFDIVKSFLLEDLISSNKIKKFLRSEGWITVGVNTIRGQGGYYEGPERRAKDLIKCGKVQKVKKLLNI